MNQQRSRNIATADAINCERYLNRLLKQEKANNLSQKRTTLPPQKFQEKVAIINKPNQLNFPKPKVSGQQQSSGSRPQSASPTVTVIHKERSSEIETERSPKRRQRSSSSSTGRETWGQMLLSNRSKEGVSSFSNFDPLRTLHFLSKELQYKMQIIMPDDGEIHQMVTDIQHALKRIPPEVASVVHLRQASETMPDRVGSSNSLHDERPERLIQLLNPTMVDKHCQTPPNITKEDAEILHRIMEENTVKLENSCKQLETHCLNLQKENEDLEKELAETKSNFQIMQKQVITLEDEIANLQDGKIRQLEEERDSLRQQLSRSGGDGHNIIQWKNLVGEMQNQKLRADQELAQLQYELTVRNLEKEKYITMLATRDDEIKDIQKEMTKIQEEVSKQLTRMAINVPKVLSSTNAAARSLERLHENKENLSGTGDMSISIVTTAPDGAVEVDPQFSFKELPSGDGCTILQPSQDNVQEVPSSIRDNGIPRSVNGMEPEAVLDALLDELIPVTVVGNPT